jgi:carbon storage regulator
MLILTVKKDEKVRIGDDISIMVVEVRGKQIRVGIEAPASVKILRENVLCEDKA